MVSRAEAFGLAQVPPVFSLIRAHLHVGFFELQVGEVVVLKIAVQVASGLLHVLGKGFFGFFERVLLFFSSSEADKGEQEFSKHLRYE